MSQPGGVATLNGDSKTSAIPSVVSDDRLVEYYTKAAVNAQQYAKKLASLIDTTFDPIPASRHVLRGDVLKAGAKAVGMEAIFKGEVAVITLAGGQASRLGADVPKGMYPLDLGFDKPIMNTLFYQQATQLTALLEKARQAGYPACSIGWIIMTSTTTDARTRAFVKEVCDDVGFPFRDVLFIVQPDLPIYRLADGSFLLDDKDLMLAPNGNGGLYETLQPYLSRLRADGYRYFHAYCVDNILCYVADPVFIGASIQYKADCACKAVEKTNPEEKIGVIGMQNLDEKFENPKIAEYIQHKEPEYHGKQVCVIEYSEISPEQKTARNPNDPSRLMFSAGNIANHFFTIDFLDVACEADLPMHRAEKNVRHRESGSTEYIITKGVKLERFIFDVFQFAANFLVLEVDRTEEFSPLKNSNDIGTDCAVTCKNALTNRQKNWLNRAGVNPQKLAELPNLANQISKEGIFLPSVAYSEEDLHEL